jgi:23S rRNA pseudouridine1911/1915/1917 synthase
MDTNLNLRQYNHNPALVDLNLDILFEDNHLIIVNKPAGMLVQWDKDRKVIPLEELAKVYLRIKKGKEPDGAVYIGLPHRIDRPTSGIVILCKTSKSLERMCELFANKKIHKTYWAIIEKGDLPKEGHWVHYLRKHESHNKSSVSNVDKPLHKRAELKYKIIAELDNYMLAEVDLMTGRHHQIRAQFSHHGFPIKGDVKYGFKRINEDGYFDLHSKFVTFIHPVSKEEIRIEAPGRKDKIWKLFEEQVPMNK